MIKYADRGLVEMGTIRDLFDHLYYIVTFVWFLIGLRKFMFIISHFIFFFYAESGFGLYLSKGWDAEISMKYLQRCQANFKDFDDGSKIALVQIIFIIIIFLPATVMFIGIRFFVYKNSKSSQIPAKYGRYQRNLLTFSQTTWSLVLFICGEVAIAVLLKLLDQNSVPGYEMIFIVLYFTRHFLENMCGISKLGSTLSKTFSTVS